MKSLAIIFGGVLAVTTLGIIVGAVSPEPPSVVIAPGAPGVNYSSNQSL